MYEKSQKFGLIDGMFAAGLAMVTVGVGLGIKSKMDTSKVELIKSKEVASVTQGYNKVTFDISGEVIKPGVYKLPIDSRVSEAMTLAGGLTIGADREWVEKNINRAKRINDGEKIYIPKKNVGQPQGLPIQTPVGAGFMPVQILGDQIININTAAVEELDKLEGVGPSLASKIIEYRVSNGGFKNINELKLVSGIGDKMFEKIKDKVGL